MSSMKNEIRIRRSSRSKTRLRFRKIMNCLCSGEQVKVDQMKTPTESPTRKNYSTVLYSSPTGENQKKVDTGNIEEAESSLRESGCLNYEEARALLGRYEYQKGNIEQALHVFEGIDISAITDKIKIALAIKGDSRKRRSQNFTTPPLSLNAVSLLLEVIFLKSKSLQSLGRYKEAAQSCTTLLDILESSLPAGLLETYGNECKLQETVNKSVELLPQLWKQADSPRNSILSYRRSLLHHWNLDSQTNAKIQKDFAVYLLYSGAEYTPPSLQSQLDSSFVPRNNTEEAILLLMILLRKFSLKRIEWDPSVLDHLSFAFSVSGGLGFLANQVEELPSGVLDRKVNYYTLALCYYGQNDDLSALNLLKMLLNKNEDPYCVPGLLMASKICASNPNHEEEGIDFARRSIACLQGRCDELLGVGNFLLGISQSTCARSALTDTETVKNQTEALESHEKAAKLTNMKDPRIIYELSLENAEQRKLDSALRYAKKYIKLDGGSSIKGFLLLGRILSGLKRYKDAETIIDAALDQTGKWDQAELLKIKAKLQMAEGHLKNAIETYTQLLAVLQVQSMSNSVNKYFKKREGGNADRNLQVETWIDLALIYIRLSQWRDAEICLSKAEAIAPYSASRWHTIGLLCEAKGQAEEALNAFEVALDIDPTHVRSLVSIAVFLRQQGSRSRAVVRSFLTGAVRADRMNASAWFNLGLFYKEGGPRSVAEAAECFQAAASLVETEPVEPFR